ncbi:MAG: grasp-with-spasm system SPASM domain peptide maturase [Bacteroidales bacterium]|jgi:SPASM domain peptide maturase of grasp-with-spasm system|nr:grasp-with-spasm system SPASM domain peptide maturase [Bacteroidales bacterium]
MSKFINYFILFSNCVIVKGHSQGAIYDLTRERYLIIPNDLIEIIKLAKKYTIKEIKNKYKKDARGILQYINLLIEKEYGFLTEQPFLFPDIDFTWQYPSLIRVAIIEFTQKSLTLNYADTIFDQIILLGCKSLQIVIKDRLPIIKVEQMIRLVENRGLSYIEIVIDGKYYNINNIKNLLSKYLNIRKIVITNSKTNSTDVNNHELNNKGYIQHVLLSFEKYYNCFENKNNVFKVNLPFYCESVNRNNCLNQKLCIDSEGNIKNCPHSEYNFGNIKKDNIGDIVKMSNFQKYWFMTKDEIKECKRCEYRYMCLDCRVFIEDKKDIFSKPMNCDYKP